MKLRASLLLCSAFLFAQPTPAPIRVNSATAKWTHDKTDPPGAESITLREDPKTGALELLARYPAGHVFAPHWHNANERIVMLEGKLSMDGEFLEPGGYAFLPAKQVQRMACVSTTRCAFYVYWDGKLDFHRPD